PFIRTPAMDRLAAEGVTFDAAYCNNPLCVPSRLSFLTGQYTHHCRGWDNASPLAADAVTWPHLLGAAGYDVALSGKMHLIGDDPLHGFQEQLARDLHIELQHPIFPWEQGIPEAREPWPGVVRTDSRVPPGPGGEAHPAAEEDAATPPTGPGRTPEIDADDAAVDAALAYLRARAHGTGARPFALCVGLLAPHFPFVVPEPFFSQYFPHHADLPDLPDGHLDTLPPAARRLRRAFGFSGHSDAQVRRARAAYYGLVSYADDKLRQILDVLDECGLADDTVVIHTSDHGEMLGEHGLWRKMSFYEQSARVPLQVRWPGRAAAGHRVAECVSLVDVSATIAAAAGAASSAAPMDGRSLAGLLAGPDPEWRDEAFAEHTAHGTDRPRAMLRRGRWKLCLSGAEDPEPELYDVVNDPGEFTNLAGHPAAAGVQQHMTDALLRRWDWRRIDREVRAS
ncbi:MAG: sulfatase-like hydrolase/transferase, partial [Spirochaetaceae bacterium]|nr:sulfatase-like hydrolase/transferase [Spirochaetaceae bacterium]